VPATRVGKTFPWLQSASTAIPSGRLRCAMWKVVGSWPLVFPASLRNLAFNNPDATHWVPGDRARKKSCRCDLLHKGLRRPALNHQNGSENIANCRFGHSYRLCPDRHRRGCRFSRADLSHSDLTAAPVRYPFLDIEYDNTPSGFIRPAAFLTHRRPSERRQALTRHTSPNSQPRLCESCIRRFPASARRKRGALSPPLIRQTFANTEPHALA
jgi:hypothetical protein